MTVIKFVQENMQATLEATKLDVPQELLKWEVQSRLQSHGYMKLDRVQVDEDHGTVTLSGTLDSFFLKQLAQEYTRKVAGVERVINEIDVA